MAVDDRVLVARVAELLGREARLVDRLGGSGRSTVLRVGLTPGPPETVVVKYFARSDAATNSGGYGLVRELAGLRLLDDTPDLLAEDLDLGLLVMTDLGDVPTLADFLQGDDADLAWASCEEWARAVGTLCANDRDRAADFADLVAAHDPDSRTRGGPASPNLPAQGLARLRGEGIVPGAGMYEELDLFERLLHPEPAATVVTPGDLCPDNALFTPNGLRFCDLEGSSIHHVALDVAYVVLPFGTCWCLYDAPADFVPRLTAAFHEGVGPDLTAVLEADGGLMVQAAAAFTVLMMTELSWDAAHGDAVNLPPGVTTPRQRMFARWRWAARSLDRLPVLQQTFARTVELAVESWPRETQEWPRYPAFAAQR